MCVYGGLHLCVCLCVRVCVCDHDHIVDAHPATARPGDDLKVCLWVCACMCDSCLRLCACSYIVFKLCT